MDSYFARKNTIEEKYKQNQNFNFKTNQHFQCKYWNSLSLALITEFNLDILCRFPCIYKLFFFSNLEWLFWTRQF